MNEKRKIIEILKTLTLVLSVMLIGLLISACQTPVDLKNVDLPTQKPLINEKAQKEDFVYPTKNPSTAEGQKLFGANCASCHSFEGGGGGSGKNSFTVKYIKSTTP